MDNPVNDNPAPAGNDHSEWQETWKEKLSHVDDQLIDFFHNVGEKAGDVGEEAKKKVQDWLDHTDMDEKARANWEKAKADGKVFSAQVQQRITHLVENGKIKWAELTKKD